MLFNNFDALCEVRRKHDSKFLTMNTNAKYLYKHLDKIDGLFDFIDIPFDW